MHWKSVELCGLLLRRGAQIGFVVIVAALAIGTLIQSFRPLLLLRPLDEYRNPAPWPDVFMAWSHGDRGLAGQVNAWFDDRMGFRAPLTRLANQIDYSIFGYSKKVVLGKDGWLFNPVAFTVTIDRLRKNDGLKYERALFTGIAKYLERKNIRLVLISTPLKEVVHRDLLPSRAPHLPDETEFDRFRDFLKAGDNRDWIYIDSRDVLARSRTAGAPDVYYRTDPHLTAFGNLMIAKEMVNRIAEAERVDWRWKPEFIPVPELVDYGIYRRYLSVFSDVSETNLFPLPRTRYDVKNPPPGEVFEKSPPNPFEVVVHNDTEHARLPRTMLFGNSFVDWYATLGAFSHFKDLYRMRGEPDRIGLALQSTPPGTRYLVLQFWEFQFPDMISAKVPSE